MALWPKEKQRIVKSVISIVVMLLVTGGMWLFYDPEIEHPDVKYEAVEITGPVLDLGEGYYSSPEDVTEEDIAAYDKAKAEQKAKEEAEQQAQEQNTGNTEGEESNEKDI